VNDDNDVPNSNKVPKDPKCTSPKPYTLPLPLPQRIAKVKLDFQCGKLLEVFKKLYINIPFIDALSQMPSYAKFLKKFLSNKRKVKEHKTNALTKECSVAIQIKLPTKLKDPASFSIPCVIGHVCIDRVLCDLGSSVSLMSPFSM